MEGKRILLIDDHPVMREGLAHLIGREDDLHVCGEAGPIREARELVEGCGCDLAVVDLTLPDGSGLELIREIRARHPETAVLVISMHDEMLYAERVLRAGARGYIMKEAASENLVAAIRTVLEGGIYVSSRVSGRVLESFSGGGGRVSKSPLGRLTDREFEVFELIGQGKSGREVAGQLHISPRTVDAHRAHIREKLGMEDGAALVRYAVRWVETGEDAV